MIQIWCTCTDVDACPMHKPKVSVLDKHRQQKFINRAFLFQPAVARKVGSRAKPVHIQLKILGKTIERETYSRSMATTTASTCDEQQSEQPTSPNLKDLGYEFNEGMVLINGVIKQVLHGLNYHINMVTSLCHRPRHCNLSQLAWASFSRV